MSYSVVCGKPRNSDLPDYRLNISNCQILCIISERNTENKTIQNIIIKLAFAELVITKTKYQIVSGSPFPQFYFTEKVLW
jgi:hypothetical protein